MENRLLYRLTGGNQAFEQHFKEQFPGLGELQLLPEEWNTLCDIDEERNAELSGALQSCLKKRAHTRYAFAIILQCYETKEDEATTPQGKVLLKIRGFLQSLHGVTGATDQPQSDVSIKEPGNEEIAGAKDTANPANNAGRDTVTIGQSGDSGEMGAAPEETRKGGMLMRLEASKSARIAAWILAAVGGVWGGSRLSNLGERKWSDVFRGHAPSSVDENQRIRHMDGMTIPLVQGLESDPFSAREIWDVIVQSVSPKDTNTINIDSSKELWLQSITASIENGAIRNDNDPSQSAHKLLCLIQDNESHNCASLVVPIVQRCIEVSRLHFESDEPGQAYDQLCPAMSLLHYIPSDAESQNLRRVAQVMMRNIIHNIPEQAKNRYPMPTSWQ